MEGESKIWQMYRTGLRILQYNSMKRRRSKLRRNRREVWSWGAAGGKRRTCNPPATQPALSISLSLPFSCSNTFSTTSELFPTRSVCISECVYECSRWGLGLRPIKALLKHFWCCWLMLKQGTVKKESKWDSESERGRERVFAPMLSRPAQWFAACLSILWAQRCEMSQQPNSNIKLSCAAKRKSKIEPCWKRGGRARRESGLVLTLSPITWPSLLETF